MFVWSRDQLRGMPVLTLRGSTRSARHLAVAALGLGLLWSAACARPTALEWPTSERGQAIVSVLIQEPGGIVAGPWAGLPAFAPALTTTDEQQWLIAEYDQTFEALQLAPPILPRAKVETTSAGLSLEGGDLPQPARSWRGSARTGAFLEDTLGVSPAEFGGLWARDLACPHFESHLAPLPSPIGILLPLDGRSALGVSEDGRHYLISPSLITPLRVEGWPGGDAGFGASLGPTKVALGTSAGAVVRGTITEGTLRYEAPVWPFAGEPEPSIRAVTGAPGGEPLVAAGIYGAVAIIQGQTSTVVHHLFPAGLGIAHQRLAWTDEGEVLGLYRQVDLGHTGVWRLNFTPTPRVTTEVFGTSSLDTPNELARIQGEWTIAGSSQQDLRDQQALFRNRRGGWERFGALAATLRVEGLADAPAWDGLVYSTRSGARIGAQARLGQGRACPDVSYRLAEVGGGDVIGLVVLSDGRVIAALEKVEQVLLLRPHRPWIRP